METPETKGQAATDKKVAIPKAKGLTSLRALNKVKKDKAKKVTGSRLSIEGKNSNAHKRLAGAMVTRGWIINSNANIAKKDGHEVNFSQAVGKGFVTVDRKFTLSLGKGAIVELDAFMDTHKVAVQAADKAAVTK
jgi:hypothetical protein